MTHIVFSGTLNATQPMNPFYQ